MSQSSSDKSINQSAPLPDRGAGLHISGLLIVIFATILQGWAVAHSRPLQSANDRSRWCTVWSLVERGTYHIDEIDQVPNWSTIDKVRHRHADDQPWHFYSSKPPLFSTVVAGVYWLEKQTLGYSLTQHTSFVSQLILLLVNVLPMFFALLSFRKSLAALKVSLAATSVLLVTAGFASMLNPFLTTLNNHTPAAICILFCLAAMIRLRISTTPARADFAITGVTAALACCLELPAAVFSLITFFYVLRCDWRATAKYYVPAAIVPLAAFFVTNWICTGGVKPFYAYYGKSQYVYVHEGIPSYWSNPQGIDANTESTPVYLLHCMVGHHGILSITPLFLLTLAGWWLAIRNSKMANAALPVNYIGAGLSIAVLWFYLTRTSNYNYGGNSATLRWMLWLTPFFWYGMIPAVERLTASVRGRALIVVLMLPSLYSPFYSLYEPWQPGWIFQQMERHGWINYRTRIPPFSPPRFSVFRQLPMSAGMTSTWKSNHADSGQVTITTRPAVSLDGSDVYPWQFQWTSDGSRNSVHETLVLNPQFIESGTDIAPAVKAIPDDISLVPGMRLDNESLIAASRSALLLLRGLPVPRVYNAASERYFQYTRDDGVKTALRCDRGASRVLIRDPKLGRCWYRCDVLYCDELPFGVVQWRISITAEATNELLRTETWTCQDLPQS